MKKSPNELAYPCGLIAKYFFNDRFKQVRAVDKSLSVTIDDKGIAFPVDVNSKFKVNDNVKKRGQYYRDLTDEHLMVWYQLESFSDFKKLYGKIQGKLEAGKTYEISVEDNYDGPRLGT